MIPHYEPRLVVRWNDSPRTEATGFFVADTLLNGAAGGGIRMREGLDKDEVLGLARTMTLKFTVFDPLIGGGKAGINYDPAKPDKRDVLERFFEEAIAPYLRSCYGTGGDLNVSEEEVLEITQRIGIKHPQLGICLGLGLSDIDSALERLNVGVRLLVDRLIMTDVATGYGLAEAAGEAANFSGESIDRMTAAIQGFGCVGAGVAKYLYEAGVKIVAVSDESGAVYCADGLDIPTMTLDRLDKKMNRRKLSPRYELIPRDALLALPVNIFVPAAGSHVITMENVRDVGAQYIIEGANMPIVREAEDYLAAAGRVILPDFVANAGTAGLFGILMSGYVPVEAESLLSAISVRIREVSRYVLSLSRAEGITTREAAELFAWQRIQKQQGFQKPFAACPAAEVGVQTF